MYHYPPTPPPSKMGTLSRWHHERARHRSRFLTPPPFTPIPTGGQPTPPSTRGGFPPQKRGTRSTPGNTNPHSHSAFMAHAPNIGRPKRREALRTGTGRTHCSTAADLSAQEPGPSKRKMVHLPNVQRLHVRCCHERVRVTWILVPGQSREIADLQSARRGPFAVLSPPWPRTLSLAKGGRWGRDG